MTQDQLQVEISFRDEKPQELRSALEEVGATEIKEIQQKGMVGIEWLYWAVLGLGAFISLVTTIMRLWNCGVVVDARGAKLRIERNCDLPRGTVLVISKNGTQSKLHEPSNEQLDELIKKSGAAGA